MTAREPRDLHNREDLHNVSILTFSTAGVFQHNPSPGNKRIGIHDQPQPMSVRASGARHSQATGILDLDLRSSTALSKGALRYVVL